MPKEYIIQRSRDIIFYRNNYRRLVISAIIFTIIGIGLLGIAIYNKTKQPEPSYFATTSDGHLIEINPFE